MRLRSTLLLLALATAAHSDPVPVDKLTPPIVVSCVGDSITAGYGVGGGWGWSEQLFRMIGSPDWRFVNCGNTGSTLLKGGDRSYWVQPQYKAASDAQPNVVVIALGTNDLKPQNWSKKDAFADDYKALIQSFQALPTKPKIYVCIPPPVFAPGNYQIPPSDAGPAAEQADMIRKLAQETGATVIDLDAPLKDHPEWLPDTVHPDPIGDFTIAKTVYAAFLGKEYVGGMKLTNQLPPKKPDAPKP